LRGIFIDTSGWASLFVKSEPFNGPAISLIHAAERDRVQIVTTNYVLAELSALLMSPLQLPPKTRLNVLHRIRTADWVTIYHVDLNTDAASWDYLLSRQDKDCSLVDCSSFIVMQKLNVTDALTTDGHFEQAGFNRLLKVS
jgi:predicted nucleic acid-binding protein